MSSWSGNWNPWGGRREVDPPTAPAAAAANNNSSGSGDDLYVRVAYGSWMVKRNSDQYEFYFTPDGRAREYRGAVSVYVATQQELARAIGGQRDKIPANIDQQVLVALFNKQAKPQS